MSKQIIGKHRFHEESKNKGRRPIDLAGKRNMVIASTQHPRKDNLKWTRTTPQSNTSLPNRQTLGIQCFKCQKLQPTVTDQYLVLRIQENKKLFQQKKRCSTRRPGNTRSSHLWWGPEKDKEQVTERSWDIFRHKTQKKRGLVWQWMWEFGGEEKPTALTIPIRERKALFEEARREAKRTIRRKKENTITTY